eukprot:gene8485-8667_t
MPLTSGNIKADAFVTAAQAFISAQLNAMSGVVMPPYVKAAQVFLKTKYFPQAAGRYQVPPEVAKQVPAAVAIITNFSQGKRAMNKDPLDFFVTAAAPSSSSCSHVSYGDADTVVSKVKDAASVTPAV